MFSGSRDNCVRLWDVTRTTSISEKEVSRNLVIIIIRTPYSLNYLKPNFFISKDYDDDEILNSCLIDR